MSRSQPGLRRFATKALIYGIGALAACTIVLPAAASATSLPSTISSNMTLTKAASPYYGGTTIESGVTVTAEPGAQVRLGYGSEITVNGTLKAEGTSEDPVVFTSEAEDEYFNWRGLIFNPGSGASILDHAVVRYTGKSFTPAIEIKKASPTIEHSVMRNNWYGGIYIPEGGSPEIAHNTFIDNGAYPAVSYSSSSESSGEVNIHDNTIKGGSYGIDVYESGPVVVASVGGNTVEGTSGVDAAIRYGGDEIPADLDENTLKENKVNAISIRGTIDDPMTWTDHGYPFLIESEVTVDSEATLSLGPGFTTKSGFWPLTVNGTLKAEGTSENPVVFTSEKEDGYFNWLGLVFKPGSSASVLDHAVVRYVGRYSYQSPAIEVKKASPTIVHSVIHDNYYGGIYVPEGGSPEIADNTFIDNGNYPAVVYSSSSESSGEVNIHDNTIKGGNGGIDVYESGPVVVASVGGNTVEGSSGVDGAIRYGGDEIPADLDENTLKENKVNAISIRGTINNSMTWTDHGYPFILENDVTVGPEATLSIGPGFTTMSDSWWSLIVKGTLKAEGSPGKPVLFTTHTLYKWPGIIFEPGSGKSVLDEVEVAKAGSISRPAILIKKSSPHITHSIIRESYTYGILIEGGGSPEIDHNTITHSAGAIRYASAEGNSGAINIHDNTLEYGYAKYNAAIEVEASGSEGANVVPTSLANNTIGYNTGGGIYYSGGEIPPDIDENTLVANSEDTITLGGVLEESATWTDQGSPIVVSSTGLVIPNGVTLTATQGLAVQGIGPIVIHGTLNAEGSSETLVAFQPRGTEKWSGIFFEPGSGGSTLDYVEVAKGGSSSSSYPAITIDESSPTITHSVLRDSPYRAILVKEGVPTIEGNLFRKNSSGLRYEGKGSLSAPNNDWECNPESKECSGPVGENVAWKPAATLEEDEPPCVAGAPHPGPRLDCLLYRYQPELRLSSEEKFHPDSVAMAVENWGDEYWGLWGEKVDEESGPYANALLDEDASSPADLLAEAGPGVRGEFHLDLSVLGPSYPNSQEADSNDWLDPRVHKGDNQVNVAERLENQGFADHAYGILLKDGSGKIWLEYWYFYYYNDFGFKEAGEHEGDWESVLVGLDDDREPEVFVFSQHTGSAKCEVDEVLEVTKGGGPVVYVGHGSHANYPEAGGYKTAVPGNNDEADGGGDAVTPTLENLGRTQPSWLEWPGHWGHSQGLGTSPTGPAFGHEAWDSPDSYNAGSYDCLEGFIPYERRESN